MESFHGSALSHDVKTLPCLEAQRQSQALCQFIIDDIDQHHGWISFAQYMQHALYAPGLGYYTTGVARPGKAGDFTTASEITPLFGAAISHAAQRFSANTRHWMEFGAGSGQLALDILQERQGAIDDYAIVEVSPALRARQRETLRNFRQVRWLETLPDRFSGVVLANEVLDAMPVELIVRAEQGWHVRGVRAAAISSPGFQWDDHPANDALLACIECNIPHPQALPIGYLTEIHPISTAWMYSVGQMLDHGGIAICIDYGFPAEEYYLPQRCQGTLMCHYRHHAHTDPFYWPGLQDITTHINFTAQAIAAKESGLNVLAYTSQARFLLDAGITQLLLRTSPEDVCHYLPQAQAVNTLLSPAEMGELFKVLVIGKE